MKKIFLCFSFIGALTLPANASVSANVSFATDYIWRGMTQTLNPIEFDFKNPAEKKCINFK